MKCAKGIWLRCGLLPYRLRGQQLALALLLRDKPRTAAQLAAALTEKGYPCDSQMLEPAARPRRHDTEHRKRHRLLHRRPACKRQFPRPQRLLTFL